MGAMVGVWDVERFRKKREEECCCLLRSLGNIETFKSRERFVRKEAQPSRDIAALGIYVSPCGSYVRGEVTMLLRLCRTTRFRPIWKLQMATEKVDSIVCSIAMGAALSLNDNRDNVHVTCR